MSDHPIIATPHSVEAVEAVVQYPESVDDLTEQEYDDLSESFMEFVGATWSIGGAGIGLGFDGESGTSIEVQLGQYLVKHLDNTVTVHDTDPRIEPTLEWRTPAPIRGGHYYNDEETVRRLAEKHGTPIEQEATYPVTLAGKPYTLVGEWVEVAE